MDNYDDCLARAQKDREIAAETKLPREREIRLASALRWEEMAVRAQQVSEATKIRTEGVKKLSDIERERRRRHHHEAAEEQARLDNLYSAFNRKMLEN